MDSIRGFNETQLQELQRNQPPVQQNQQQMQQAPLGPVNNQQNVFTFGI